MENCDGGANIVLFVLNEPVSYSYSVPKFGLRAFVIFFGKILTYKITHLYILGIFIK